MTLEPPDSHYFLAATGWMELGNPREALNELEQISPDGKQNPDVLELYWSIYALFKEWDKAMPVTEKLVEVAPQNPSGWINRSYTLHEMKRTKEALELLLPAVEKFPENEIIPYNLACYYCQLGDLSEARRWLKKALNVANNRESIKSMALNDPDLKPLQDEIESL